MKLMFDSTEYEQAPMSGMGSEGFTLVELMVAMLISLVIIAAGFVLTVTTEKATTASSNIADAQQNARSAMELISRDVKMAGFGMQTAVGNCLTPIVPQDQTPTGPDTGPDRIQLVVPAMSGDPSLWRLNAAVLPPGGTNKTQNTVTLYGGAVAGAGMTFPAIISIAGSWTGTAISAASDVITLNPLTLIGAPATFPINTPVYWLQCVTYQVIQSPDANNICGGRAPCLARGVTAAGNCDVANSPCVPVVDGIEDLQFAYACDGCVSTINSGVPNGIIDDQGTTNLGAFDSTDFVTNSTWAGGAPPLDPTKIRLVQISVVARELSLPEGFGEGKNNGIMSPTPLQVSDHLHSADPGYTLSAYQQYRRRLLTKTVETRNLGLGS
ncbi:MAG TPA: PilW family protein [Nitrospira sp.]|nr:PilW family protein [Nitrospira sp.]